MSNLTSENVGTMDRTARLVIGLSLSLSLLVIPSSSAWIAAAAFAAAYPLVTGLTAIDPFLTLVENVKFNLMGAKKLPAKATI